LNRCLDDDTRQSEPADRCGKERLAGMALSEGTVCASHRKSENVFPESTVPVVVLAVYVVGDCPAHCHELSAWDDWKPPSMAINKALDIF
jgi:hypothetical protein